MRIPPFLLLPMLASIALAEESSIFTSRPLIDYVQSWPAADVDKRPESKPLLFQTWDQPYAHASGEQVVTRINQWYAEGRAAGLYQDGFRSFDDNHSKVGNVYPQLRVATPVPDYNPASERVFKERVTFGVQSLGLHRSPFGEALAIPEFHYRCAILEAVAPGHLQRVVGISKAPGEPELYRALYEGNCLLVRPAVWNYEILSGDAVRDELCFLTPFFLYSVGKSGSDARLLKPILYAAAALPPALKTRMLRTGTYVPSVLGIFKHGVGGGSLRVPQAHVAAYPLPEEAEAAPRGVPFLEGLIERAQGLKHIPAVTAMSVSPSADGKEAVLGHGAAYFQDFRNLIAVSLGEGQQLDVEIDLSSSWTDVGQQLTSTHAAILREPQSVSELEAALKDLLVDYTERHPLVIQKRAEIAEARSGGGATLTRVSGRLDRWRLKVPWSAARQGLKRTDVLFLANDGTYDGAPAYVSVRHLQRGEKWLP